MSGTNSAARMISQGPAVVLVAPQLGENIGFAARAMLNCGLGDLRLVRPRCGWPSPEAEATSAGALARMEPPQVFDTTAEAVADLRHIFATTARRRDMEHLVMTPAAAGRELCKAYAAGEPSGLLFGAERAGLENDDVALADGVVTIPANPAFSSLNLGQAVLIMAYEWLRAHDRTPTMVRSHTGEAPATKGEVAALMRHLEQELDRAAFFKVPENRPAMVRALRTLLTRSAPTSQEVRTLHGVLTAISGRRLGGLPRGRRRSQGREREPQASD